jgi:hypothetical protein
MALPNNRPLTEASVSTQLADLSTASSTFVASPWRGKIIRVYSVIHAAITTTNATWTVEINGTAVSGGATTVTQSGSAAGDVDTFIPTGANTVNEGDTIEFISGGESDTTCITTFTAVIERD